MAMTLERLAELETFGKYPTWDAANSMWRDDSFILGDLKVAHLAEALVEIRQLREALEHYSSPNCWEGCGCGDGFCHGVADEALGIEEK